ncbi:2194_t:CDS:1, partial [Ambispora gerdemannii]
MSQKDSAHSFESAIAENSSDNNKKIEVERPSTPTNSSERIYSNLQKKNRTPPTPSKRPNNSKKHTTAYNIEINKKEKFNKQLVIQEKAKQNSSISPTIFSSLYTSFSNMG